MTTHYHHIKLDGAQLIKPLKIVLIADIHLGLFSGYKRQLLKITQAINAVQPDIVLVAGDWTYDPETGFVRQMQPLADIKAPVYSVADHDEGYPGPPLLAELDAALEHLGIQSLEGQFISLQGVRLFGTGDLWAGKAHLDQLAHLPQDLPWIIMAHNPDTIKQLPPDLPFKPLFLAGHTHGGQVYLPFITDWSFKRHSKYGFRRGLYQLPNAQVFVTAGTGMVFAPFRCGVVPVIDVLTIKNAA